MSLTENEMNNILIILRCTSSLSIIGSTIMMIDIIKSGNIKKQCRMRILTGVSFFDIISSISLFMGPWPTEEDYRGLDAYGNYYTCQAQGFFTSFLCGSALYNLCLAIVYYLIVKHGKTENWLRSNVEPWMHIGCICYNIGLAIAMLPFGFDAYNNSDTFGCAPSDKVHIVVDIFMYYAILLVIGLITILMILLYRSVKENERKVQKYSTRGSMRNLSKQSRSIAYQCFAFSGSFYVVYIPFIVYFFIELSLNHDAYDQYLRGVLVYILIPLQGFLNALVYFRPRIATYIVSAKEVIVRVR